jgi:hypothetical protein
MEVLGLLRSKLACLKTFLEATRAFAARARAGDFAGLDAFERDRDASLRALALFDRRLSAVAGAIAPEGESALSEADRGAARAALAAQSVLLEEIFRLDAGIMRAIEAEQLRLLREVAAADRSRDVMNRFKSGAESAPGLDRTV